MDNFLFLLSTQPYSANEQGTQAVLARAGRLQKLKTRSCMSALCGKLWDIKPHGWQCQGCSTQNSMMPSHLCCQGCRKGDLPNLAGSRSVSYLFHLHAFSLRVNGKYTPFFGIITNYNSRPSINSTSTRICQTLHQPGHDSYHS